MEVSRNDLVQSRDNCFSRSLLTSDYEQRCSFVKFLPTSSSTSNFTDIDDNKSHSSSILFSNSVSSVKQTPPLLTIPENWATFEPSFRTSGYANSHHITPKVVHSLTNHDSEDSDEDATVSSCCHSESESTSGSSIGFEENYCVSDSEDTRYNIATTNFVNNDYSSSSGERSVAPDPFSKPFPPTSKCKANNAAVGGSIKAIQPSGNQAPRQQLSTAAAVIVSSHQQQTITSSSQLCHPNPFYRHHLQEPSVDINTTSTHVHSITSPHPPSVPSTDYVTDQISSRSSTVCVDVSSVQPSGGLQVIEDADLVAILKDVSEDVADSQQPTQRCSSSSSSFDHTTSSPLRPSSCCSSISDDGQLKNRSRMDVSFRRNESSSNLLMYDDNFQRTQQQKMQPHSNFNFAAVDRSVSHASLKKRRKSRVIPQHYLIEPNSTASSEFSAITPSADVYFNSASNVSPDSGVQSESGLSSITSPHVIHSEEQYRCSVPDQYVAHNIQGHWLTAIGNRNMKRPAVSTTASNQMQVIHSNATPSVQFLPYHQVPETSTINNKQQLNERSVLMNSKQPIISYHRLCETPPPTLIPAVEVLPRSNKNPIFGMNIFTPKRNRGRPKGSKNKIKKVTMECACQTENDPELPLLASAVIPGTFGVSDPPMLVPEIAESGRKRRDSRDVIILESDISEYSSSDDECEESERLMGDSKLDQAWKECSISSKNKSGNKISSPLKNNSINSPSVSSVLPSSSSLPCCFISNQRTHVQSEINKPLFDYITSDIYAKNKQNSFPFASGNTIEPVFNAKFRHSRSDDKVPLFAKESTCSSSSNNSRSSSIDSQRNPRAMNNVPYTKAFLKGLNDLHQSSSCSLSKVGASTRTMVDVLASTRTTRKRGRKRRKGRIKNEKCTPPPPLLNYEFRSKNKTFEDMSSSTNVTSKWRSKYKNIVDPIFMAQINDLIHIFSNCQIEEEISPKFWPHSSSNSMASSIFKPQKKLVSKDRGLRNSGKRGRRTKLKDDLRLTSVSPPSSVIMEDSLEVADQRLPLKKRHHFHVNEESVPLTRIIVATPLDPPHSLGEQNYMASAMDERLTISQFNKDSRPSLARVALETQDSHPEDLLESSSIGRKELVADDAISIDEMAAGKNENITQKINTTSPFTNRITSKKVCAVIPTVIRMAAKDCSTEIKVGRESLKQRKDKSGFLVNNDHSAIVSVVDREANEFAPQIFNNDKNRSINGHSTLVSTVDQEQNEITSQSLDKDFINYEAKSSEDCKKVNNAEFDSNADSFDICSVNLNRMPLSKLTHKSSSNVVSQCDSRKESFRVGGLNSVKKRKKRKVNRTGFPSVRRKKIPDSSSSLIPCFSATNINILSIHAKNVDSAVEKITRARREEVINSTLDVTAKSDECIDSLCFAKRRRVTTAEDNCNNDLVPDCNDDEEDCLSILPKRNNSSCFNQQLNENLETQFTGTPRKEFLEAGLFSQFYKKSIVDDNKSPSFHKRDYTPSDHKHGLLPPPIYCGFQLRAQEEDFRLPFYIWWQSVNQQLPGRDMVATWNYKKIKNNVYFDSKAPPMDSAQACHCKKPLADDSLGCGDGCINRLTFTECDIRTCPLGEKCSNNFIQRHKFAPGLERFMTQHKGWAIRTKHWISSGTFIMEYLGEIVSNKEFKRRMLVTYADDNHHYCLQLDRGTVIDGHRMGSECRFVNHSCSPNCEMQKWNVNGFYRMALFSLRDIASDEELTYDYNFSLFNPRDGQKCLCGSDDCRGVIGGRRQRRQIAIGLETSIKRKRPSRPPQRKTQAKIIKASDRCMFVAAKCGAVLLPKPLSDQQKKFARKRHLFLLRNIRRRYKLGTPSTSSLSPPVISSEDIIMTGLTVLSTQRSVQTRRLAIAQDDPKVGKIVALAKILREIFAKITHLKDSDGNFICHFFRSAFASKRKLSELSYSSSNIGELPLSNDDEDEIDLQTIEKHINIGHYVVIDKFDRDILLVFQNIIRLYGCMSPEGKAALSIRQVYIDLKPDYISRLTDIFGVCPPAFTIKNIPVCREDVIICPCGQFNEEGLMVQCEECSTWQHGDCVGVQAASDQHPYKCARCTGQIERLNIASVPQPEYACPGETYYVSLMRENLQVRVGDTVYVLRAFKQQEYQVSLVETKIGRYHNCGIPHKMMSPLKGPSLEASSLAKGNYPTFRSVKSEADANTADMDIFRIERLWVSETGDHFAFGHHYLRPHETFHEPTRRFYPNEVFRAPIYEVLPLDTIWKRCWVLEPNIYCRGRPLSSTDVHVYICEFRVDKTARLFNRISKSFKFPTCTKSFAFHTFDLRLKPLRNYTPHEIPSKWQIRVERTIQQQQDLKKRSFSSVKTTTSKKPPPSQKRLEDILPKLLSKLGKDPVDVSYLLETERRCRISKKLN